MYLPSRICDIITLLFDTRFQFCFHSQIGFDVLYTFCYMFCTFNEFLGIPKKRDVVYPTTLNTGAYLWTCGDEYFCHQQKESVI